MFTHRLTRLTLLHAFMLSRPRLAEGAASLAASLEDFFNTASGRDKMRHTCHILPPSEIDLGLCLAVFAGSGGKYLFHRIGWKGRIWQLCETLLCKRQWHERLMHTYSMGLPGPRWMHVPNPRKAG